MEREKNRLEVEYNPTQVFRSFCEGHSIRRLAPGLDFDANLIDVIPGLIPPIKGSRYFGSHLYSEILKENFGDTRDWLKSIPQEGRWSWAIYDQSQWIAVSIDWLKATIELYNPSVYSVAAVQCRADIIDVSTRSYADPPSQQLTYNLEN
jgi:hypothetical protein